MALDPTVLSHSRLDQLLRCGQAFKWKYVDELPDRVDGSASIFGTVMHRALERWSLNRRLDLVKLVEAAWLEQEGIVGEFVKAYAPLSLESRALIEDILKRRPEIRAPRMTKDYKGSDVSRRTYRLWLAWVDSLNNASNLRFTKKDPLPSLYDDSILLAQRYAKRMKHLPSSLVTEFKFDIRWHDFNLRGTIDSVEPVLDRVTGELLALGILDYKTSGREPSALKHYRQMVFYDIAVETLLAQGALRVPESLLGLPRYCGIDFVRWDETWKCQARHFVECGPKDRRRLLRDLEGFRRMVENEIYLPADTMAAADYCDFGEACCLKSTGQAGGEAKVVRVPC